MVETKYSILGRPPVAASAPRSSGVRAWGGAIAVGVVGLTLLAIQAGLSLENSHLLREAAKRGFFTGQLPETYGHHLAVAAIEATLIYASIIGVEIGLCSRGLKVAWALPAFLLIFLPALFSPTHLPVPLGPQWTSDCFGSCSQPWFRAAWFAGAAEFALIAVPGVFLVQRSEGRSQKVSDQYTLAALLLVLGLSTIVFEVSAKVGQNASAVACVAVFVTGLLSGSSWRSLLIIPAYVFVAGNVIPHLLAMAHVYTFSSVAAPYQSGAVLVYALIGFTACSWERIDSTLRTCRSRPLELLLALNVLNVLDALLTATSVRAGHAVELNPLVQAFGLPMKIAFVGVASVLLFRYRPTLLIWPTLALALVVCYHLSGFLVNAGM